MRKMIMVYAAMAAMFAPTPALAFQGPVNELDAYVAFMTCDLDNDGGLNLYEYEGCRDDWSKWGFYTADSNSDGAVDSVEWNCVFFCVRRD